LARCARPRLDLRFVRRALAWGQLQLPFTYLVRHSFSEVGITMTAVIIAFCDGSRFLPLTISRPRPMGRDGDRPTIVHIIELLKKHGITEVVITLQYHASVIQEYLGDGTNYGLKIHYTVEESPLGTAGSVRQGIKWLDDTFIVVSGDALTDFDL